MHWSDQIGTDHAKYFKTISEKYAVLRKMAGDVVDPSDTNKINLVGSFVPPELFRGEKAHDFMAIEATESSSMPEISETDKE